jgi:hypothetical protein
MIKQERENLSVQMKQLLYTLVNSKETRGSEGREALE